MHYLPRVSVPSIQTSFDLIPTVKIKLINTYGNFAVFFLWDELVRPS